jgi:hypothetical protein
MTSLTAAQLEHVSASLGQSTMQGRRWFGDLIPGESQSQITPDSLIPIEPLAKRLNCDVLTLESVLLGADSFVDGEMVAVMMQRTTAWLWTLANRKPEYKPAVHIRGVLTRWTKTQAKSFAASRERMERAEVKGAAVPSPTSAAHGGPGISHAKLAAARARLGSDKR